MADNEKDPIDLGNILLPKKETPGATHDSATRVNAGELLAQEQSASLAAPHTESALVPPPAPVPPADDSAVKPLQTYRSDIESLVQKGGVSEVSIAAAEAMRKNKKEEETPQEAPPPREPGWWKKWVYIGAGVVLLLGAIALIVPVVLRTSPTTPQTGTYTGLIFVDEIAAVGVVPQRQGMMAALTSARDTVDISLGLIAQLFVVADPAAPEPAPYPIVDFLSLVAPLVPAELLRTLEPEYVLGVHSYDRNQPFLLLRVDSYDVAYRAMLNWERSLRADLIPLFNRSVSPQLAPTPTEPLAAESFATSTSSTSSPQATGATTTQASSTPSITEQSVIIATAFVDVVAENRDTRAIVDTEGNILLLWTFLDRRTILITTNEATLREVISRLAAVPIQYSE